VRETLTGRDVAFVVVSSPDPMAVSEAMFFVERLHEGSMAAEALVLNRVRQAEDTVAPSADRLAGILQSAGVEPSTELGSGFSRAWRDAATWARKDAQEVARGAGAHGLGAASRHRARVRRRRVRHRRALPRRRSWAAMLPSTAATVSPTRFSVVRLVCRHLPCFAVTS
jgi:anion-transporting  ArsA/GET3 family ATPase